MNPSRLVKISKYLSKHLRHQPERLGLTLEAGGWVLVEELLKACVKNDFAISLVELEEVVAKNDKQRFSFNGDRNKIRANQGHSVDVDLQLTALVPPNILYHGTGHQSAEEIRRSGLLKMSRHHVHLSTDKETALKVGARHGKPVIFKVDAETMHQEGFSFYCSENGVWLVDHVPPKYLSLS